ncbi:pyridoxamine 5'-phosphate oxidase [Tremella mesenterica]|uniref:pyridoxal 5'-phosphate synthase n=1 Tax=Tremella mesenterica TaxID=5217 RepID=A0A4Q1BUQ0_TREME|nr:pyridoxamine 5'-phosphate oxidase [Tremella mesenterica]
MSTNHIYGGATSESVPDQVAGPEKIMKTMDNTDSVQSFKSSPSTENKETPAKDQSVQITTHNDYHTIPLELSHLHPDPLIQFINWFKHLRPMGIKEPESMTLSTISKTSNPNPFPIPSSRTVLLKEVDKTGFTFYTNYKSRKSKELMEYPYAALSFYWKEISRAVRIVGKVEKVNRKESEDYFKTRPRGSQLGAWASPQSCVVEEGEMERRVDEIKKKFEDGEIVCPDGWGGWRVVPFEVEFWSGRPSRLHDRFRYTREEGGEWKIDRLAP